MSELSHPDSINRDYIRLLQVMRRFVKEEFAVSIRMTQEDSIAQLLDYAERSRNHVLQEMGKELRDFTRREDAAAADEESMPHGNVRYYRGAAIATDEDEVSSAAPAPAPAVAKKVEQGNGKRIYRGRVIS